MNHVMCVWNIFSLSLLLQSLHVLDGVVVSLIVMLIFFFIPEVLAEELIMLKL